MRFLGGVLLGILIVVIVIAIVAATGAYNVAATSAPSKSESRFALYTVSKSVQKRAPNKTNPFSGAEALRGGLAHYKENCVMCHGAPGVPESEAGMGLNPPAPDLTLPVIQKMTDGELFWVVSNGIRMSGMPAFSLTHKEDEIWQMVAFVRHLPEITKDEQNALKPAPEEEHHHEEAAAETREEPPARTSAASAPTPHTHPPGAKAHKD